MQIRGLHHAVIPALMTLVPTAEDVVISESEINLVRDSADISARILQPAILFRLERILGTY